MSQFYDILRSSYGDLDQPDFSSVRKTIKSRPYEPFIKRLRDFAVIEELADTEDDVCFGYLVKGQNGLWKLELSAVGPFSIFVRLKQTVEEQDFVVVGKNDLSSFEERILLSLQNFRIKLLSPHELSVPVPLTLYNTPKEQVTLYHAFFCDRPGLPWCVSQSKKQTSMC